ncbi:MAG: hypothetical protein AAB699_02925 [Patescibacteria group bacterium]
MTVHTTDLVGVIMRAHAYTTDDKKRALEAGIQAHRVGKSITDCPAEFLPKMGDPALYDYWVAGFNAAARAGRPRAD